MKYSPTSGIHTTYIFKQLNGDFIKVGATSQPLSARLQQIQNGQAFELEVIYKAEFGTRAEAFAHESVMKRSLGIKRLRIVRGKRPCEWVQWNDAVRNVFRNDIKIVVNRVSRRRQTV